MSSSMRLMSLPTPHFPNDSKTAIQAHKCPSYSHVLSTLLTCGQRNTQVQRPKERQIEMNFSKQKWQEKGLLDAVIVCLVKMAGKMQTNH